MADDTAVQVTSATQETISTDHVTTLNGAAVTQSATSPKVQRVKVGYGDDGTFRDASALFPLPVSLASSGSASAPITQALTALGAATLAGAGSTTGSAVLDVTWAGNASFHLLATAFVGTVVFEQSFDPAGANGTWAPVPVLPEDGTGPPITTLSINTAAAYVRQFTQGMFGASLFRVRVTAFTSGSLTAYLKAGPGWVEPQPALAPSASQIGTIGEMRAGTLVVTGTGAAAAVTVTLPAPAAGLFHYITSIRVERFVTAATTASATRPMVTTTNLNGLTFTLPADAVGIGVQSVPVDYSPATPLRSAAAATASTVVVPLVATTTYQATVTYFTAA